MKLYDKPGVPDPLIDQRIMEVLGYEPLFLRQGPIKILLKAGHIYWTRKDPLTGKAIDARFFNGTTYSS